jgi:pteridine reductase
VSESLTFLKNEVEKMADEQTNKVVLITGAGRRIGKQIARTFHDHHYNVLVHHHKSQEEATLLAAELNLKRKGSAVALAFDLREIGNFESFVTNCLSKFNRIDVLINNASTFFSTSLETLHLDQYNELIETNLRAPLFLSKYCAAVMEEGVIINIVDIYGQRPLKNYSAYSISKAGLDMLTRSLALELAPRIRVNGVSPGAILWPEDDAGMTATTKARLLESIPTGELGTALDIARSALFLASSTNYITGQILNVDGGSSIGYNTVS